MSSDMRACRTPSTELIFYRTSVKTWPFDESSRQVIGYYKYEEVARAAGRMIQENNMQRIPGGIDSHCDCFRGTLKDLRGFVLKTDIDLAERDRLLSWRFNETVPKRNADSSINDGTSSIPPKLPRMRSVPSVPEQYITRSFNPVVAGENFAQGVASAQKYVQDRYGNDVRKMNLTFRGSDICAMSIGPRPVNPIELQEITLIIDSDADESLPVQKDIGKVLPEKDHLYTLKTGIEIADEIKGLVDRFLEQNPELIH